MRRTGPDRETRHVVLARAMAHGHPRCERCGGHQPEQIHHRKPRGRGGTTNPAINSPANLAALCTYCHREIEAHRTAAYRNGWLVHNTTDPTTTAVLYRGRWALLTDTGTVTTVEEPHHDHR